MFSNNSSFLVMKKLEINKNILPFDVIDHEKTVRIVSISDTHNRYRELTIPEGDILIHAGDITGSGHLSELEDFNDWLLDLPHKHKVVIAGNHELSLDPESKTENKYFQPENALERQLSSKDFKTVLSNCHYLEYSSVNIFGLKIYGFPGSLIKPHGNRGAFQFKAESVENKERINAIPTDTDILVTHGPPYGVGDEVSTGTNEGNIELMKQVKDRIKPILHIFGHIHEDYGAWTNEVTTFANAASIGVPRTNPILNDPIIFDIVL